MIARQPIDSGALHVTAMLPAVAVAATVRGADGGVAGRMLAVVVGAPPITSV